MRLINRHTRPGRGVVLNRLEDSTLGNNSWILEFFLQELNTYLSSSLLVAYGATRCFSTCTSNAHKHVGCRPTNHGPFNWLLAVPVNTLPVCIATTHQKMFLIIPLVMHHTHQTDIQYYSKTCYIIPIVPCTCALAITSSSQEQFSQLRKAIKRSVGMAAR